DANADGTPDGWNFSWAKTMSGDTDDMDRQEPNWGWDDQVLHSGAHSVRVGVARAQDDGVWSQENVKLPGQAKIYRLSAWLKVQGAEDGGAHLATVYLDAENKWLGADYDAIYVDRDTDWRRFVALVQPPANTDHLRVRFWVNFRRKGPITAWADDLNLEATDLQEAPPMTHIDLAPMPKVSQADRDRGFVPFAASYLDVVMPATVPTAQQLAPALSIFATPGEREPISFAVRALRDVTGMTAAISPLAGDAGALPEDAVEPGVVRYLVRNMHPRTDATLLLPAFIEPMHPVDVAADTSQWYWFTVHVPEDAAPGAYRGTITVSAGGGSADLPVTLEVLPIKLVQPPGMSWGMYDYARTYSDDPGALLEKYRDQVAHGMTSVGLCGNHGAEMSMQDGRVSLSWTGETDLERAMAAYLQAGFTEPVQWLMGGDTSRFAKQFGELGSDEYAQAYAGVIRAILDKARQDGWPQIIFQPVDEAFEHRDSFERMMVEMAILKGLGVPVEADGMNGKPEGLDEAFPLIDYFNFHDGPFLRRGVYDADAWQQFQDRVSAAGKHIWFYNVEIASHRPENARFSQGFHLWRNHVQGAFNWSYQSMVKDPYALHPQGRFIFMHRFPPMGDEPGGPSIGFEALREGIDDYKYLYTWDRACERALADGTPQQRAAAEASRRWLDQRLGEIDYSKWNGWPTQGEWLGGETITDEGGKAVVGHLKVPGVWGFDDYDAIRRRLAEYIMELQ
ncbi:MAG TPA: hypothetical protein VM283_05100, partial [Armatimonadota bacterium]|nr:hypothetical protein [Armatimonadota bacterium]